MLYLIVSHVSMIQFLTLAFHECDITSLIFLVCTFPVLLPNLFCKIKLNTLQMTSQFLLIHSGHFKSLRTGDADTKLIQLNAIEQQLQFSPFKNKMIGISC